MYPFLRLAKEFVVHRNAPKLGPFETHHSTHLCWPWDIDLWLEMNNGRVLTLYDLGRLVLAQRVGLFPVLKREKWLLTIAGSVVRYRKRVRIFDRVEMRSRMIGWDDKFVYLEHSMWHRGDCTSHLVVRMAFTDSRGLVRMNRVSAVIGLPPSPELPDWVRTWIAAEDARPWPPMQDAAP